MNNNNYQFNAVHYVELLKKDFKYKPTSEERSQLICYQIAFFEQLIYEARSDFLSLLSEQWIVKDETGLNVLSKIRSLYKKIGKKQTELEKNPELILNISIDIDPKAEKFDNLIVILLNEYEFISDLEIADRNYQDLKDLLRTTRDEMQQYLAS